VMDTTPSMDTNSIKKVAGIASALLDRRHLFRLTINVLVSSITHLPRNSE
jgi:hypothetical protein